jgi:hypothetical protein
MSHAHRKDSTLKSGYYCQFQKQPFLEIPSNPQLSTEIENFQSPRFEYWMQ